MTEAGPSTPRRFVTRRTFTGAATAAALLPATAAPAAAASRSEESTEHDGGELRHLTLYAEKLPNGLLGYGLEKGKATVPGPLLEMYEGDTLVIELVNNLDVAASLHVHGVDYDVESDGTALNRSTVPAGESRSYTWRTHRPGRRDDGTWEAGSAGYWHYHDHAVGTSHGTTGVRKGLYGGLVVRRKGDPVPDKSFTVVFVDMTINNMAGHKAPNFSAKVGEQVEIVMITHGDLYHTFHVHGHRWADNRTGLLTGPDDNSAVIDTRICGPGESFGVRFTAGERVGAGAWMYHCHVQGHSDMGMAGLLLVADEDGSIPPHEHLAQADETPTP